jgi:hypothetical protein
MGSRGTITTTVLTFVSVTSCLATDAQPLDRSILSRMAAAMLIEVQNAREAIARDNEDNAVRRVGAALDQVLNIEQSTKKKANELAVSVYSELEQVALIGPIQTAKREVAGQMTETEAPTDEYGRSYRWAYDPYGTVREVEGKITAVTVDLGKVAPHLEAAKRALVAKDKKLADQSLAAALSEVNLVSEEANLALARARQNLALARNRIYDSMHRGAAAALKEASEALTEYGKTAPANRIQRVTALEKELRAFLEPEKVSKNSRQLTTKIEGWWEMLADWTTPKTGK